MTIDDGWEPIEVRLEGPDAGDEPRGASAGAEVHHLAVATEPIIGPGLEADEEVDVTLPRLARHLIASWQGALLLAKVRQHGEPLQDFLDVTFHHTLR